MTNRELASAIRVEYTVIGDGEALENLMAEAEKRGVKLTVTLNQTNINLRQGGTVTEGPSRTIDKHPYDVATGLEEL